MSERDDDDDDIPKIGLAAKRAEDEVPRIGRGRTRFKVPMRELFLIGMTLITLIVILTMQKTCADGVGKAFNNLAPPPPDAGVSYIPLPGPPAGPPQPSPSPSPGQPLRSVPSTPGR